MKRRHPLSDSELIDRLRGGSQEAFDVIFRSYYGRLVGLAESMLRDRAVAEEVAQDVMVALWRRRDDLQIDTSLAGYLLRSTRNRALNHLRHQRVKREAEPLLSASSPRPTATDDAIREAEIDAAVRAAIGELPPRCREVFELSRVNGLRYAEIAETLEISIKTVEAQMGKALRLLREKLAPFLASE